MYTLIEELARLPVDEFVHNASMFYLVRLLRLMANVAPHEKQMFAEKVLFFLLGLCGGRGEAGGNVVRSGGSGGTRERGDSRGLCAHAGFFSFPPPF